MLARVRSDKFDALDRQILHALQIDARAPHARIAQVLGVSDQTVARRHAKLCAEAGLRLHAVISPHPVGEAQWFLRVRCVPSAAERIAAALARRPDTSWVNLLSAGTEVACATRTGMPEDVNRPLTGVLAQNTHVLEVTAHRLLHTYFGGPQNILGKLGALDEKQVSALRTHLPGQRPAATPVSLDADDRAILAALSADPRIPLDALAAATGLPPSTARHRLNALRATGTLYFDLTVRPRVLSAGLRTALWLTVAPSDLDRTGQALARHREVAYVAATTGRTNLYASLLTRDDAELHEYLATTLAELASVREAESSPVVRTLKTLAS
jgi:DNA-binding Lrp family transcriptional regulator